MSITVEDIAQYPSPGMDYPSSFSFSPDNRYLTYLKSVSPNGSKSLFALKLSSGIESLVASSLGDSSSEESLEEQLRRQRLRQMGRGISQYTWITGNRILIPESGSVYILDSLDSTPRLLVNGEEYPAIDPKASPDGSSLAFVCKGDIYSIPIGGGTPSMRTIGGRDGTTRGLADYIAQEEMRRSSGYWWSPDSSLIAFTEVDETHIPEFHISHLGKDFSGDSSREIHRYPFAGCDNPQVRLGVIDMVGHVTWADLSEYEYIARVDWLPDGHLAVQCQNREQTCLDLLRFTGDLSHKTVLLREVSEIWINLHDMYRPLKDGRFLWASERSGYRHLYLYEADGQSFVQLTDGEWQVESISSVDEIGEVVYFTSTKESPTENHLYRISFRGADLERVTLEAGMHTVICNARVGKFVDIHQSPEAPPAVTLEGLTGQGLIEEIHRPTDRRVEDLGLKPPEFVNVQSPTGEILHGAVYRPDRSYGDGPYPTLIYVYGGPHAQLVTRGWGLTGSLRPQYLRERGYLVFVLDNRGSTRRGIAFESHIKNSMGTVEVEDQIIGVRWLIEQGLADPRRVGIYGWSYGGYMALMCMAQAPDIFKAAVAGAPVTSWDGYDTHYTERYMGTPDSNPDGYENGSVMAHVSGLQGKLLLIHGLIDENVHFRHTARLINSLISSGKDYELAMFPDERHMPRRRSDRVYLEKRLIRFFEENL